MEYILLLVGFILLIKGADFFVEGSSSLAGILKVPSVIIGLTIVAMGTSAPEASVSINAGQPDHRQYTKGCGEERGSCRVRPLLCFSGQNRS